MSEISGVNTIHKFDIIKFARDIIQEVDKIRSYEKVFENKTQEAFQLPKESRINAFFRLIGLPMFVNIQLVDQNGKLNKKESLEGDKQMTPGFDTDFRNSLQLYVVKDASAVDGTNISSILSERERNLLKMEVEIGTDKLNSAMTAAFITSISIQPNIPSDKDGVGSVGPEGNKRDVFKKLKPLITSYRDIIPKNHELARPFVPDTTKVTVGNDVLSKPFIETVARIRLLSTQGAEGEAGKKKQTDLSTTIKNNIGAALFSKLFGNNSNALKQANVLEAFIINKMLAAIDQLANKWVQLEKERQKLAKDEIPFKIKVKAASAKISPLGKRIDITSDVELLEKSPKGKLVIALNKAIVKDEALLGLLPTDETANISTISGNQTGNIVNSALINPFTSILNGDLDRNKKRLGKIKSDIKRAVQAAENLRIELEMMTGEFTGLSVPDVVAVIIGLFLIDKNDLIALLDKNVRDNMLKDRTLSSIISSANTANGASGNDTANGLAAVKKLEIQVDNIFTLLNTQIRSVRNKTKRTPRGSRRPKPTATPPTPNIINLSEEQKKRSAKETS